ncbi:MAG: Arc family DNA-binding protein [Pseudolabrys sp.]|nr:Arc family DNA-binding protein [Pseudolabrys sp.]
MKQLKVAFPDDLRSRMQVSASANGRSLADEIRRRVEESFDRENSYDVQTGALVRAIDDFAALIRVATGHLWHEHAGAHWAFRNMITARLQRLRPQGERSFGAGELPNARIVASDDPEAIGHALETLNFHQKAEK